MIGIGVYMILGTPNIVCRVVDSHDIVSVHPVIFEMDSVEFRRDVLCLGSGKNSDTLRLRRQYTFEAR